jgi:predicted HNH restriction endonuclease
MITLEKYDITQFSMRKAWKAEFYDYLKEYYRPSLINAGKVFKAINNLDAFIRKQNLGEKMLCIKEIRKAQSIKQSLLSHQSFALGGMVSANDYKVIVLERYIEFLNKKAILKSSTHQKDEQQDDVEQTATEGLIKEVKYFRSKRNRAIRDQCAERDHYTCQVCGFNFEKVYGERGKRFIEVHHINPMANFDTEHEIKLKDLISLCSNCHSMVHYGGDFLDIDELRKTLKTSHDPDIKTMRGQ